MPPFLPILNTAGPLLCEIENTCITPALCGGLKWPRHPFRWLGRGDAAISIFSRYGRGDVATLITLCFGDPEMVGGLFTHCTHLHDM